MASLAMLTKQELHPLSAGGRFILPNSRSSGGELPSE
jgi:hypothetical protein